ncbi:MAG: hypothetical protein QM401_04450 [Bacillota bacterium]|nr:hypothetical protein [Bacillota bacterium]
MNNYNLVEDLEFWPYHFKKNKNEYLLGSISVDKYLIIEDEKFEIIQTIISLLKKNTPISQIEQHMNQMGFDVDIQRFCDLLYYKKLLLYDGEVFSGQAEDPLSKNKDDFMALSKDLISIDTHRRIMTPKTGATYTKIFYVLAIVSVIYLTIALLENSLNLNMLLNEAIDNPRLLPWVFVLNHIFTYVMIFLHEFSHIMFARKYGIYIKSIKLRLYMYVSIFISVQLPGLYTLKPLERGFISLAGPLTNLLVANFSLGSYLLLNCSQFTRKLLVIFSLYNYRQVVNNLNPFMPSDGYHFISTYFFGEPDVKSSLLFELQKTRIRDLTIRHKAYLLLYALSIVFMLIITNTVFSGGLAFITNRFTFNQTLQKVISLVLRILFNLLVLLNFRRFFKGSISKKDIVED